MSITNEQIAHRWFYRNTDDERYYPNYKSCGYNGNVFLSYGTAIATLTPNKNGEIVLLLSNETMSNTTAKHIVNVWKANPNLTLYRVQFRYGVPSCSMYSIAQNFIDALKYTSNNKMTRAERRCEFIALYEQAQKFARDVYDDEFLNDALEKYQDLYDTLTNDDKVKELKAKIRKKDAEKRKQLKKELDELLKTKSLTELAELAYTSFDEKATKLKNTINPDNELTFVWKKSNGDYKTSKGITIEQKIGDLTLNLWKNNKLKHGMKVDIYTVLSVTSQFVTIGCHKIPVQNLTELTKC